MSIFNTIHEKKSAAKTAVVLALLILSFFFVGMQYMDPPQELGVEINLGTSDTGSGDIQPLEPIKSLPLQEIPKEEIVKEETSIKETPDKEASEDVATQETEESIRIRKEAEAKRKAEEREKAEANRIKREEEAKRKNLENMMGGLNNSDGTATGGEGDNNTAGDKGSIDGNPYANSYYGGGTGNGKGYGLGGRNRTGNNKFIQDCNEEGRVVVKITVNKNGKVIKAQAGVKGTTNSAACLLEPARKTALSYRFNADAKAPEQQIGFIVINFRLGE